jgi:putative sigma-54 modulation protein
VIGGLATLRRHPTGKEAPVEITVSARHTEVSPALRAVVEEKIGRLSRFLEGMDRADVHFTEERNPRIADKEVCEVTLEGHGHHVRCKVAAPDGFAAIDAAVSKLEHQLHKLKTKVQRRQRGGTNRTALEGAGSGPTTALLDDEADEEADGGDELQIVKTKKHALKPMTAAEAVLQLDLVDHDFFLFTNADTGRAAVLYRRRDGHLGLIDDAG